MEVVYARTRSVGSVTGWLRQLTEESSRLSDCHRQFSVTGDPVVLTRLVDLSCLLSMGTTDSHLYNQILETARVSLVNSPVFYACKPVWWAL